CNRTAGVVPFSFDPTPVVKRSGTNRLYCLTLRVQPCADPDHKCCNQALAKVEWWSKDVCRSSVKNVFLSGVKIDQQWAPKGTFKIPALGLERNEVPAQGLELCMELSSTSNCPTLASFCARGDRGSCFYSVFNADKDCCPVNTFAALGSRR
ncbi:Perphorin-2, partial [Tetrabaena socialis]